MKDIDINTLIGEATAYDKSKCSKSDIQKAGSKVYLLLLMAKARIVFQH